MRIIRNIEGGAASPSAANEAGCGGAGGCGLDDVRCGCGSLLARVVGGEVELKCRRCKQVWRLALPGGAGATRWRLLEGSGR